jgi:hypothetical protein
MPAATPSLAQRQHYRPSRVYGPAWLRRLWGWL